MTKPRRPRPERVDFLSPSVIAGGSIALLILLCAVPVFWIFLPFVVVFLVILYLVASAGLKKARGIAASRLRPLGRSELCVEIQFGLTSALVFNDWGLVLTRFGRVPIELAWSEIRRVDEPAIARVAFHDGRGVAFEAELSQERYLLVVRTVVAKIGDRTDFDIDPTAGRSRLLDKLQRGPLRWEGRFGRIALTAAGIEHNDAFLPWQEIDTVHETSYEGDEAASYWELRIASARHELKLNSLDFDDGREVGNSGYDAIKAILEERIPDVTAYVRPAPTAVRRAMAEFQREREALKVGYSVALRTGKLEFLQRRFTHLAWLVDTFYLEVRTPDARVFFRDYAELLQRMNRPAEAAEYETRSGLR